MTQASASSLYLFVNLINSNVMCATLQKLPIAHNAQQTKVDEYVRLALALYRYNYSIAIHAPSVRCNCIRCSL